MHHWNRSLRERPQGERAVPGKLLGQGGGDVTTHQTSKKKKKTREGIKEKSRCYGNNGKTDCKELFATWLGWRGNDRQRKKSMRAGLKKKEKIKGREGENRQ